MRVVSSVPLLLLAAYGALFGARALGRSPLAYDDHPGQLYRLYHVVERGWAPWTWNPGWWAGYPEMQFYPPGFAYAGALVHAAAAGALSVPATYHVLLWVAYLLPGLTVFALLRRVLRDPWAALPAAFVALTLSAGLGSGVEGGVHIGMVSARLGFGLLPLVPLTLARWIEAGDRFPSRVILLIAAVVLVHPAHAPAAVGFLAVAALARPEKRAARVREALVALGLAAACTAFWTVPLLARLAHTHALAWGTLSLGAAPLAAALVVACVPAWRAPRTRLEWSLTRWAALVPAMVIADATLVERLGVRWLPADRIADSAWLAVVIAAGLGIARALDRLPAWEPGRAFGALGIVTLAIALARPGDALTLWPRAGAWPAYGSVERGLALPALWNALAASAPGRVLFVRSGIPLVHGTAWYRPHTHVTSLAPHATGRPIVGGTFTHPSAVAAYVYRGHAGPGPLTLLAEQLDGHTLFGVPLGDLDRALEQAGDRLGISIIVALEDDVPALAPVAARARWRHTSTPPFELYARGGGGVTLPEAVGPDRWELDARGAAGTWVSTRVAYYPLWRAESGARHRATRAGPVGDLEVRLEDGDERLTLRYGPGLPEMAGLGVTLAALLTVGVLGVVGRRRGARSLARRVST